MSRNPIPQDLDGMTREAYAITLIATWFVVWSDWSGPAALAGLGL